MHRNLFEDLLSIHGEYFWEFIFRWRGNMKMWLSHFHDVRRHIVGQSRSYQYDSLNFDSWVFSGMTVSRLRWVYQQPSVFYLIELRERTGKETNGSLHVAPGDDDDDYKSFSTFYRLLFLTRNVCCLPARRTFSHYFCYVALSSSWLQFFRLM